MRERVEDVLWGTYRLYTPGAVRRDAQRQASRFIEYNQQKMAILARNLFLETNSLLQPLLENIEPISYQLSWDADLEYKTIFLRGNNSSYHIINIISTDSPVLNLSRIIQIPNTLEMNKKATIVGAFFGKSGNIFIITGKTNNVKKFQHSFTRASQIDNLLNQTNQVVTSIPKRTSLLLQMDNELRLIHGRNTIRKLQMQTAAT